MKTSTGDRPKLTDLQHRLIIGVGLGAAVIATIGFAGSYAAVRKLAEAKHFGTFAIVFPIGVDAGILVLLALDLLLTWLRMPLALLRHIAWLLTAATIAFNAAAAWPDPIGTGMHAVIPILFVAVIEAARHAIGRTADITAGRHMDSVRMVRWLLDPISTFRLWRRMKLWELRSYEAVIQLEQSRLVERARLRARYGRRWRSKAPVSAVMALRLTRYGRPLSPVSGVLDIEHAPAHSEPAPIEVASREPEPGSTREPAREPGFETTVQTALVVAGPEPITHPAPLLVQPADQQGSREPVLSPAEPTLVSRAEPSPEPAPEPEVDEAERQILELANRLRNGEPLTKTTAAEILAVSPATAGRRLKEARGRINEGTGFYP
ncbi:DUF2637 domain-containing protein [Streptomyces sp. NPDC050121]|uniref:DUF2637 domain-containing protein n=1 Tax=Streptomyces sp. NPDC050121 TaxID=3365601 RepID=UPI00378CD48F